MTESHYRAEEEFHGKDRKQFKKERRRIQEKDRSKFKKTDSDRLKKISTAPEDPNLIRGRVIAVTGDGICVHSEGKELLCSLKGLLKKEKLQTKNLIAVGDWVRVLPETLAQGRVVYIEERTSFLSRQDLMGKQEQFIAVNVDQVLITASVVLPTLKPALIDRYLIAAEKGNIHPILVLNKLDRLADATEEEKRAYEEALLAYEKIGYVVVSVSASSGVGIEALRSIMKNKTSVFSGQSGVGKSSLLNAAFGLSLRTGDLTQKTRKGSHTTTTARLIALPEGGFCVDTPGIRSFAIRNLTLQDIRDHYREFAPYAEHCRYLDCTHLNEPICAVRDALEKEEISSLRFASYQALVEETLGIDQRSKTQ